MITLYTFGPFLGTPDASPFVIKTMLLLKLAGVPFTEARSNPFKAPRRLLPYIDDAGTLVPDSGAIQKHISTKYNFDFAAGLNAEQRAVAWSVERMCEDHLYFAMLHARWADPAAFARGLGRHMFGAIPAAIRPVVKALLRRTNAKRLHGHGLGRLSRDEIQEVAIRDIDALATLLRDNPYLFGQAPCGADATIFAMLTAIMTPPLDIAIRAAARRHQNLAAYCQRITARYFPDA